jgi:hypothetical protein
LHLHPAVQKDARAAAMKARNAAAKQAAHAGRKDAHAARMAQPADAQRQALDAECKAAGKQERQLAEQKVARMRAAQHPRRDAAAARALPECAPFFLFYSANLAEIPAFFKCITASQKFP